MRSIWKPYTYYLKWSTGMKYIGARYSDSSEYGDIWQTYFTSSKLVEDYVKVHGNPDVVKIIGSFSSHKETLDHEGKLLKRLDASNRKDFLNQTNGWTCTGLNNPPHGWLKGNRHSAFPKSSDHKLKISKALKGKKNSLGAKRSADTLKSMSNAAQNRGKSVSVDCLVFFTVREAAEAFDMTPMQIRYRCASENYPSFHWE